MINTFPNQFQQQHGACPTCGKCRCCSNNNNNQFLGSYGQDIQGHQQLDSQAGTTLGGQVLTEAKE